MSEMNPIILIQLLMQYHNYCSDHRSTRIFKFTKNNRMKIHTETEEETTRRKSFVKEDIRASAEKVIRKNLSDSLHGRLGTVWIDPEVRKIAVPLQNYTSESGFGVLPTGSRISIPEWKKIRAFTYWEKVDDIDLSCFGMSEEGDIREFSWRNMWSVDNDSVIFSGDETSGYNGGSEYFDIDLDRFMREHPVYRYIIFCDNVYTRGGSVHFKDCLAKGGFMMRDISDSGNIYEPKTVGTSFRLTTDSSFCYMFALDLKRREMVWLNIAMEGNHNIAGNNEATFRMLLDYMKVTDVYNVHDLFTDAATEVVSRPEYADVIITNGTNIETDKAEVINAWDTERILSLIQPKAG